MQNSTTEHGWNKERHRDRRIDAGTPPQNMSGQGKAQRQENRCRNSTTEHGWNKERHKDRRIDAGTPPQNMAGTRKGTETGE
ncbi:Alpha-(13)-fucosyltransferase 4 [Dissostichus eleginoides]|uniref:Alpha-(13)-fucosyltransferase 4 n=1 Tax=Dissostichus eleginoides TaxID=100907 RepID=A0AAD9EVR8_DISEL|nr:Alpha-(13)-fucosyltransferase 4 [Dissostichus eleginoides]